MIEYKRTTILGKYFSIQLFECPIEIVLFAATFGSKNVTIENYRHYRNPNSMSVLMKQGNLTIVPRLKQFLADFQISNAEFVALKNTWDTQGCYAVFHESDNIKFKAIDLNEHARYKALDHFKWTLEIFIPDSASDGWGRIVSPDQYIIDQIESYIQHLS